MLLIIKNIIYILLILNLIGYILVVLRQKVLLKNNMILINKSSITPRLLEKVDLKEFFVFGEKVKSGDEVKVVTNKKEKLKGILIGISKVEETLLLVTYDDKIRKCDIKDINKFKIISKYGYFF